MVDRLTEKERRCLDLASRGRTNPQIAEELGIAEQTVKTHMAHAYARLGVERVGNARVLAVVQWVQQREGRA